MFRLMYKDNVIFVTGASNGIRGSITKKYAEVGEKLIATDIMEREFEEKWCGFGSLWCIKRWIGFSYKFYSNIIKSYKYYSKWNKSRVD